MLFTSSFLLDCWYNYILENDYNAKEVNNFMLPQKKICRYCLADIAKGLFNGMIGNYLLYFFQPTVKSGLPQLLPNHKFFGFITVMALISAVGKLVDAFSDPIVASLSDKSQNKKGRRLPFMQKAAFPYAFSVLAIFLIPFKPGSLLNALWVCFFLMTYYLSYTFYFIPKNALVPEIIEDSKSRVAYYGMSTAFFMGASSFMYTAPLLVNLLKNKGFETLTAWQTILTLFSIIGFFCLILSSTAFNEMDYVKTRHKPTENVYSSFKKILSNHNFLTFTLADLCSGISMAFFQASMLYYITVLLNIKESQSFLVMLAAIAVALCLFPIVIKLSQKHGKKKMLIIAEIIFTIVYLFIGIGDYVVSYFKGAELLIGLSMGVVVAFPFACINILPQSVVSDIIQEDTITHHVNREGMFSAIKTFIEKIAFALAMMGVSSILAIGASQGEVVGILGVKLTGLIAMSFGLISLIFYNKYDEKRVLKTIERKKDLNE